MLQENGGIMKKLLALSLLILSTLAYSNTARIDTKIICSEVVAGFGTSIIAAVTEDESEVVVAQVSADGSEIKVVHTFNVEKDDSDGVLVYRGEDADLRILNAYSNDSFGRLSRIKTDSLFIPSTDMSCFQGMPLIHDVE